MKTKTIKNYDQPKLRPTQLLSIRYLFKVDIKK